LFNGWRRPGWDDRTWFLILWAGLPLLFFSASKSKLPHYILPIFPPLAMLIATRLVQLLEGSTHRAKSALGLTWLGYGGILLFFLIGHWQPAILPEAMVAGVISMPRSVWLFGAAILILSVVLQLPTRVSLCRAGPSQVFLVQAGMMIGFLIFASHAMISASTARSSKAFAEAARPWLAADTQVVIYGAYFAGLAFYLRRDEPIWVVIQNKQMRTFLGNYYALGDRPAPSTRWGKALFETGEFGDRWRSMNRPLLVLAKAKNRARLERQIGAATTIRASVGDYVWLAQR
jgi:hypothetical protein